jgi:hypothetical protein
MSDIREGLVHQYGPWRSSLKISRQEYGKEFDRLIYPKNLTFTHGVKQPKVETGSVVYSPNQVIPSGPLRVPNNGLNPSYVFQQVPEVADWVKPEHKVPFLLCESLYSKPFQFKYDYSYQASNSTSRIGVWQNSAGDYFVGLRGTVIFAEKDIKDDVQIAFRRAGLQDLSLVEEAKKVVESLLVTRRRHVMVGGHSLGGFAAMAIGKMFNLNTCSFNGAAPITNPVLSGPGPILATHYHIVGDLISTHMGCQAASIVRVDKKLPFGFITPHSTERFYSSDPTTRLVDATSEDVAMCVWSLTNPPGEASTVFISSIVFNSPIPCSSRSNSPDSYMAFVTVGQAAMALIISGAKHFIASMADFIANKGNQAALLKLTPAEIQSLARGTASDPLQMIDIGELTGDNVVGEVEAVTGEIGEAAAAEEGAVSAGFLEGLGDLGLALEDGLLALFEIGEEMLPFLLFL